MVVGYILLITVWTAIYQMVFQIAEKIDSKKKNECKVLASAHLST